MNAQTQITADETPDARRERLRVATRQIDKSINAIWELGRNSVIGWRSYADGIEVLTMSTTQLLQLCKSTDQYNSGTRQMDNRRILRR